MTHGVPHCYIYITLCHRQGHSLMEWNLPLHRPYVPQRLQGFLGSSCPCARQNHQITLRYSRISQHSMPPRWSRPKCWPKHFRYLRKHQPQHEHLKPAHLPTSLHLTPLLTPSLTPIPNHPQPSPPPRPLPPVLGDSEAAPRSPLRDSTGRSTAAAPCGAGPGRGQCGPPAAEAAKGQKKSGVHLGKTWKNWS